MRELPEGWVSGTIADVTVPVEKISLKDDQERQIQYVDISSIDNQHNRIGEPKTMLLADAPSRARQIIKAGDVLFSTVRPYLRNIASVPDFLDDEIASTGFAVLRGSPAVDPRFLFYKAISRDFVAALTGEQYGVSYPAVKEEQVLSQPFDCPPLPEQQRIVAKVEELFSGLDAAEQSLTTARLQLGLYRQALLKAAFEGRLTARWRAANEAKLESPAALLQRIRTERQARHLAATQEWKAAVKAWEQAGKSGRKPRKSKAPSDIEAEESGELAAVPSVWVYVKLAVLGELARGKSKHRPRNDPRLLGGEYPFIQTGEVKAANRIISSYTNTYSEFGLAQSHLWPAGTLCITIAANIAETAFLGFDACFPDSIVGFTAIERVILPKYVELFIESAKQSISAYAPATAQKNINLTTLENLWIPYCHPDEQRQIVEMLDQATSTIDATETEIATNLQKIATLRQAILKRAFSGRLVPQDPADEPAATLLAHLRASAPAKGKARQKSTRKASA